MIISKLKVLDAAALTCVFVLGGIQTVGQQLGRPGEPAPARPKAGDRQAALIRSVNKLQAELDESVKLNARLQKEVRELRAKLATVPASQPGPAPLKAAPDKGAGPAPNNSFVQSGKLIFAASATGDRGVAHDTESGKSRIVTLMISKDARLHVDPIVDPSGVALSLVGSKIERIAVYGFANRKWYPLDLREPAKGRVSPSVAPGIVTYTIGRRVYAFSTMAKHWDVAELPAGSSAFPILG